MRDLDYVKELRSVLQEGEVLLVVPPFAPLDWPSLGVHVLQACARQAGFHVSVLYANFLLAAAIGVENYLAFTANAGRRTPRLVGECLFAHSAYGLPLLDSWVNKSDLAMLVEDTPIEEVDALNGWDTESSPLTLPRLRQIEKVASGWLDALAEAITELDFAIIGVTASYEQTNASVALLKRIKCRDAKTMAIIGGANCAAEMAQGIVSLDPAAECFDYVFSGESEATFVDFLRGAAAGRLPSTRIVYGKPHRDLDALPTPDFREYVEQFDHFIPEAKAALGDTFLCYENSRGCWWGEKHHCSFCGANGENIAFRHKAPERVLSDLNHFAETHPDHKIVLVDNIMPRAYFQTLLPKLADQPNRLDITGGLKANLSLDDLLTLKRAGFSTIGAGVESLSSGLLALMNKGLEAHQAIAVLRYARATGMHLRWNFLWGFPGDTVDMYKGVLALLPLVRHLQPPNDIIHLVVTRFSPYYDDPEAHGVHNIRPLASYAASFPPYADIPKLAVNFVANYECAAHRNLDLIADLVAEIVAWQRCWREEVKTPLALQVIEFDGSYILVDTRGLPGMQKMYLLTPAQAAAALVMQPYEPTEEIAWALEHKVGVVLDDRYVPLATATPSLLQTFEEAATRGVVSAVVAEPVPALQ